MELERDFVAGRELDEIEADGAGSLGDAAVSVGQRDTIGALLEDFDHDALGQDLVGGGHEQT